MVCRRISGIASAGDRGFEGCFESLGTAGRFLTTEHTGEDNQKRELSLETAPPEQIDPLSD